jgi:hypothetical protein
MGGVRVAHQAHGFPGHSQPALRFGTHGYEFHILTQGAGDEAIHWWLPSTDGLTQGRR